MRFEDYVHHNVLGKLWRKGNWHLSTTHDLNKEKTIVDQVIQVQATDGLVLKQEDQEYASCQRFQNSQPECHPLLVNTRRLQSSHRIIFVYRRMEFYHTGPESRHKGNR